MALCHPLLGAARAGAGSVSRLGSPSSHSGLVPSSRAGQGAFGLHLSPICVFALQSRGSPGLWCCRNALCSSPGELLGRPGSCCVQIYAHTHTQRDGLAQTSLHPTIQFEPSLNPLSAAGGKYWGSVLSGAGDTHLVVLKFIEMGRMWLVPGGTRLFSCVQRRGWRKEIEAQCNVRHKGRILGGLGGRRVGQRVEEQLLSATLSWRRRVWKGGN